MIFVLHNIRSAWNVGQIFRTADAVGARIICVGYTARPQGVYEKMIAKTAIGAEKGVVWEGFSTPSEVFEHTSNCTHLALEISATSVNLIDYIKYKTVDWDNTVLWLGNEISGVEGCVIERVDSVLHLPMHGAKESLNVANALTAAAYLLLSRR